MIGKMKMALGGIRELLWPQALPFGTASFDFQHWRWQTCVSWHDYISTGTSSADSEETLVSTIYLPVRGSHICRSSFDYTRT